MDKNKQRRIIMEYLKDAENLKSTTADCTDFAVKGITNICNSFGPRPCGSDSEKYAQEQMAKELEPFCDSVTRETFKVNPKAFMSFVPHAGACLMGATAINTAAAFRKISKKAFACVVNIDQTFLKFVSVIDSLWVIAQLEVKKILFFFKKQMQ